MDLFTQRQKIRMYLEAGLSITGGEALKMFQCARLPARVLELKKDGMSIDSKMVKVTNRDGQIAWVKEYSKV